MSKNIVKRTGEATMLFSFGAMAFEYLSKNQGKGFPVFFNVLSQLILLATTGIETVSSRGSLKNKKRRFASMASSLLAISLGSVSFMANDMSLKKQKLSVEILLVSMFFFSFLANTFAVGVEKKIKKQRLNIDLRSNPQLKIKSRI